MATVTSPVATIQPTIFKELSAFVTTFIAEKDAAAGNVPNTVVSTATHLLIAIENAANIFKDFTAAQQPVLVVRVGEFKKMIACLKKADFCRLNLPTMIRHSIDIGTFDGWIPKLYATNPQHIVPKSETIVQFFGKFKYADPLKYKQTYMPTLKVGERTFEPTQADHHTLTFKLTFSAEESPFKKDKCSQFDARLIVPYEVGHLGIVIAQRRTFEFNVPVRALPIVAGVLEVASRLVNDQPTSTEHKMEWEENLIFELDPKRFAQLTFTSFDGKKQEFTAAQLEADAEKVYPNPLVTEGSYLRISQVAAVGEDSHKWKVETVPPTGI
jgi:hypothetical protein